jgi:hypothetical protein
LGLPDDYGLVLPPLWDDIATVESKVPQLQKINDELVTFRRHCCSRLTRALYCSEDVLLTQT